MYICILFKHVKWLDICYMSELVYYNTCICVIYLYVMYIIFIYNYSRKTCESQVKVFCTLIMSVSKKLHSLILIFLLINKQRLSYDCSIQIFDTREIID